MDIMQRRLPSGEQAPPQIDPRTTRATRALLAAALAAAAVLLVVTPFLFVAINSDTPGEEIAAIAGDRTMFSASESLFALTLLLLATGAIGIAKLVRGGRGTAATVTGSAMIFVCSLLLSLGAWSYMVAGRVLTAPGVDPGQAATVLDAGNEDILISLTWMIGIGLFVGLIVLAVGLAMARAVPIWHAALLGVGALLLFFNPADGWLMALLTLPLAAGLLLLAPRISQLPDEQYSTSPGQGGESDVPAPATSRETGYQGVETPTLTHPSTGTLPSPSQGHLT